VKKKKIGRLAMRQEGTNWVAYYAEPDTMMNAIFLGSIAMRFVRDEKRKDAFMSMMKEAVTDILEEIVGERPSWPDPPTPAPEHERSKE
jgi:hypothetical protein